jgi:hypothetical protein
MDSNDKQKLAPTEDMKESQHLWESDEAEVFEHDHLGNLLVLHSPRDQTSRETPVTSSISSTINWLIKQEDFKNVDSFKILNVYLVGIATNHQTEVNKLLNKSLLSYFKNITLHNENLLNLTNLVQVAASKGIISANEQKALSEDFLKTFEKTKLHSLEPRLRFLLSSTILDKIDDKEYSTFISENMDSIKKIIAKNPIFIINNLNLAKVDSEVRDELQSQIFTEIRMQEYRDDIIRNFTAEEIPHNREFAQFARTVLAAADKGFIDKDKLEYVLPDHVQIRKKIANDRRN